MWNEHLTANFPLIQAILSNDTAAAGAALAAGASALLVLPRCQITLLQQAIRHHSVPLVDLLMRHGAIAGDLEIRQLVKEVETAQSGGPDVARSVRALAACMHRHGADFSNHIDDLLRTQPGWFQGIAQHCQQQVSPVQAAPRIRRRALA